MTYQKGSTILASDYNTFLTSVNNNYAVGNADRGYGQSTISQAAVSAGQAILSTQWVNLHDMIVVCANQQGSNVSTLPPDGVLAVGQIVEAYEQASPSLNPYELANNVTLIDTNRLNFNAPSMTVSTNVWTVTRGSSWTTTIFAEVSALWASEDAARYYFNSAGQVRLHGSQPGSNPQDIAWNNSLTNGVGLVKFTAHNTTNTGSFSGSVAKGYYEMTDSYQTIFNATSGGGYYYSTEMILIQAKRLNFVGVHGGNGNGVQFAITLTDSGLYTSHPVDAGTNFQFDNVRATTYLTGIAAPTYATVTSF